MRVTLQELENEKQIVSISNSELKRNIGDRDATAHAAVAARPAVRRPHAARWERR